MAPKRPAAAELIFDGGDYDLGRVTGVLISRAEGTDARDMAIRALEVDAGWRHDAAIDAIAAAQSESGRWYKVPNRHADGWLMFRDGRQGPRSGATPGVLFRLPKWA